jgi:hypothetical protein
MTSSLQNQKKTIFFQDIIIIILSIALSIALIQTHIISIGLSKLGEFSTLGSFLAGLFFTSIFTTAPAIVSFGEIMQTHSLFATALIGACGSVIGDLIIFRFIRDRFSEHLLAVIGHKKEQRKIKAVFKLKFFRWFTFLLGGLLIASPFPDELGISLLGFTKMKMSWFIPLSFFFNFLGIALIGLIARALL